jgi:hypothetical protein
MTDGGADLVNIVGNDLFVDQNVAGIGQASDQSLPGYVVQFGTRIGNSQHGDIDRNKLSDFAHGRAPDKGYRILCKAPPDKQALFNSPAVIPA